MNRRRFFFIDLDRWYNDGNVACLSDSGVVLFDNDISIRYFERVAIPTSRTHLFKAPPAKDEGEQAP